MPCRMQTELIDDAGDSLGVTPIGGVNILDVFMKSGAITKAWDNFSVTYPSATQEVYVFKLGSTTQQTITLNYTDSTKEFLLNGAVT